MEKFLAYLAAAEQLAAAVANADVLPQSVRDAAQKVVDLGKDIEDETKRPDFLVRAISFLQHHGNLPGTPESRGEVAG